MQKVMSLLLIISLFMLHCASHKSGMKDKPISQTDVLGIFEQLPTTTSTGENDSLHIANLTNLLDSLCARDIFIERESDFEKMQMAIDRGIKTDTSLINYAKQHNQHLFAINMIEYKFRTLVESQRQLKSIFENEDAVQNTTNSQHDDFEAHGGYVFQQKISYSLPFIQANSRYSQEKTSLVRELINLMGMLNGAIESKRAWLAIDRMLEEIDLQQSSSGYAPFQRSAEGIFVKSSEIIEALKRIHESETNDELISYSAQIIKNIEDHINRPKDEKFWREVEASQELKQRFIKEVLIEQSAEITARDWFDKGYQTDNDRLKIEYYTRAIEIDPQYAAAYNNRGNAYQNINQFSEAIHDYSKTIELKPDYAPAYVNRGNICQSLGEYGKAIQDFSEAMQLEPAYTLAYNFRGMCYRNIGDYASALFDYNKAIELDARYASAFNNRGDVYRSMGKEQQAINDYNTAIELDPNFAMAYNNRGMSYKNMGNFQQAIRDHQQALEIIPNYAAAYYNLGVVYWSLKDWKAVIHSWEKCLEIEPDHQKANDWLPKAKKEAVLSQRREARRK